MERSQQTVVGFAFGLAVMLTVAPAVVAEKPGDLGEQQAISEVTGKEIPGDRIVKGKVRAIRGEQMQVDIGNPEPLYLPLKPAIDKGQEFHEGDIVIITMNDHNAIVDYHHDRDNAHHQVIKGRLSGPLTVGWEKATIRTQDGEKSYRIAPRARAKFEVIPIGVDAIFLMDETGQLVDAQLGSEEAVQRSKESGRVERDGEFNQKARRMNPHEQLPAIFKSKLENDRIKVLLRPDRKERILPVREPLPKLEKLRRDQEVVLLLDDQGYVVDIATPEVRIPAPSSD